MTRAEAMEWAEEHLTTDEYEEAFGEVAEDDEVEVLNINIPASLKAKLQIEAENKGVSITAIVISTLSKMLDPVDVEIIVEHLQEMGATVVDDYTQEQLGDIQIELKKQGFDTYLQQADRLYLRVKEEN